MSPRFKFGRTGACLAAVTIVGLGVTAGVAQAASPPGTARLTWARVLAMNPVQVTAMEKPLLEAAAPLRAVGTTAMRSIYWGVAIDTPAHAVDLYVTDPARAAGLIAAARRQDPRLDTSMIVVKRTGYSLAALTVASKRMEVASSAGRLPFRLYGLGQLDRGASLRLMVRSVAQARRLSEVPLASLGGRSVAQLAGVRLTFQQGGPVPMSRENDTAPFIGGDYLMVPGEDYCTAGFSIENSSGRDFILTANHCFTAGKTVYTANGRTSVGIPYRYNVNFDAELIDTGKYNGAGANNDEGEQDEPNGIKYYPLPALNQELTVGEQVCQDGISSYILRNAVPCNQTFQGTTSTDVQGRNGPPAWVREIYTVSSNGYPVVIKGDSGAVAFVVASATTRDIVGMVSQGYNCNSNFECTGMGTVGWGNGLLDAFGFTGHLNPHT